MVVGLLHIIGTCLKAKTILELVKNNENPVTLDFYFNVACRSSSSEFFGSPLALRTRLVQWTNLSGTENV